MMKTTVMLGSLLLCKVAFGQTCTTTISPGTSLSSTLSSAAAGATICLNSGSWGSVTLSGIVKANYVTIRSTTGTGATISPTVTGGTQYVRFSNLTVNGMQVDGASTKHIIIASSTFTQLLDVTTTNFNNNDILIDGNTFSGISAVGGVEGRVSVHWPNGPGSVPAGVTISNNTFNGGGCSDGVQLGSYGVVVGPGNVFTNLPQANCTSLNGAHVDSIQGYGQSHSVIRGNYFITPTVCLGFYDGGDNELFENNVFVGSNVDDARCVIDLGSVTSATFRHNTLYVVNPRIGAINKTGGGSGTYTENIMQSSSFNSGPNGACSACSFTHNMFSSGGTSTVDGGVPNVMGSATFIGGSLPSTWSGWQLATTSIGYMAALDGTDMGSLYYGGPLVVPAAPTNLRIVP